MFSKKQLTPDETEFISTTDVNRIKELIKNGVNINVQDQYGNTALIVASANGRVNVVKELLKLGANPNIENKDKTTPLSFSLENNYLNIADLLLKSGANPNIQDYAKETPLKTAILSKNNKLIESLIKAGADPNIQDFHGNTSLMFAVQVNYYNPKLVNLLLKAGADPWIKNSEGNTAISIGKGYIDIRNQLEPYTFNIERIPELLSRGISGYELLSEALDANRIDYVEGLILNGVNINETDNKGESVLIRSIKKGLPNKINEFLIQLGADLNLEDNNGNTPLILASSYNNIKLVNLLLANGADPNFTNKYGKTALNYTNVPIITSKLKSSRLDPDMIPELLLKGIKKYNLLAEAVNTNNIDVIHTLLSYDIDINEKYDNGDTILIKAVRFGSSPETIKFLLEAGADPFIENNEGKNALDIDGDLICNYIDPSLLQYHQESTLKPLCSKVPVYARSGLPITTMKRVLGFSPPKTKIVDYNYDVDMQQIQQKYPKMILNQVDSIQNGRPLIKVDYGYYPDETAIPIVRYGKGPFHGTLGSTRTDIDNPQYTWYFVEPDSDIMLFVNHVLIVESKAEAIMLMLIYLISENRTNPDLLSILYNSILKYKDDLETFNKAEAFYEENQLEDEYTFYKKFLTNSIKKIIPLLKQDHYTLQDIIEKIPKKIRYSYPIEETHVGMQFRERLLFELGRQLDINAFVFVSINEVLDIRPRSISFSNIYKVITD